MNTLKEKKITSLRLDKNLYSHLQEQAKKENRSINNFLEKLIKDALNFNEPNQETIQAIKEAKEEKKNAKRFTKTSELLQDLMS